MVKKKAKPKKKAATKKPAPKKKVAPKKPALKKASKAKKKPAPKKKRTPKGPPPEVQKWLEERQKGMHQGLQPTPAHATSIWDTSYIPDRYAPATSETITAAEEELQVAIPKIMKANLAIQNGGSLPDCDPFPFDDVAPWTNATIDGILPVEEWERACDNNWFDSVEAPGLDLLIIIAAHSEAQFCLDYRACGPRGAPAATYVDVCDNPATFVVVAKSIDAFVRAIVAARPAT